MPSPTGQNWPEAMLPLELRRQARVVARLAEYLAEEVCTDRNRALEAMGMLAEWCDDDPQLLEQAFADVRRDTRKATASAQAVIAQNDRTRLSYSSWSVALPDGSSR
jgi:hypothetical protein